MSTAAVETSGLSCQLTAHADREAQLRRLRDEPGLLLLAVETPACKRPAIGARGSSSDRLWVDIIVDSDDYVRLATIVVEGGLRESRAGWLVLDCVGRWECHLALVRNALCDAAIATAPERAP